MLHIPLVYKALYSTGLQGSMVYSPGLQGSIFHWFTKLLLYIPLVYKALYSTGLQALIVYSPGLQGPVFPWPRRAPTLWKLQLISGNFSLECPTGPAETRLGSHLYAPPLGQPQIRFNYGGMESFFYLIQFQRFHICTTIRTASDSLQLRGNGVLLLPETITTIPFQSHNEHFNTQILFNYGGMESFFYLIQLQQIHFSPSTSVLRFSSIRGEWSPSSTWYNYNNSIPVPEWELQSPNF